MQKRKKRFTKCINYGIIKVPNKLNIQSMGVFSFKDTYTLFCLYFAVMNLIKCKFRTLLSIVICPSVYSLFGDNWSLRFCALTSVGALFVCYGWKYGKGCSKKDSGYYRYRAYSGKACGLFGQRKTRLWVLLRRMWLLFALFPRSWYQNKEMLNI